MKTSRRSDGDARPLELEGSMEVDEHCHQVFLAPPIARFFPHHPVRGRRRQRLAVRTIGGERVEDVDDADDLREKRNPIAGEAVRIAAAIDSLVLMADDG